VICPGKGRLSVLDPADKVPQDGNKTKSSHSNRPFLCDSCQNWGWWYGFGNSERCQDWQGLGWPIMVLTSWSTGAALWLEM